MGFAYPTCQWQKLLTISQTLSQRPASHNDKPFFQSSQILFHLLLSLRAQLFLLTISHVSYFIFCVWKAYVLSSQEIYLEMDCNTEERNTMPVESFF